MIFSFKSCPEVKIYLYDLKDKTVFHQPDFKFPLFLPTKLQAKTEGITKFVDKEVFLSFFNTGKSLL